ANVLGQLVRRRGAGDARYGFLLSAFLAFFFTQRAARRAQVDPIHRLQPKQPIRRDLSYQIAQRRAVQISQHDNSEIIFWKQHDVSREAVDVSAVLDSAMPAIVVTKPTHSIIAAGNLG